MIGSPPGQGFTYLSLLKKVLADKFHVTKRWLMVQ